MYNVKGKKFTAKAVFSTWAKTGYLFDLGQDGGWFICEYLSFMKPALFVKRYNSQEEVLEVLSGVQNVNYGGYQPFENDNNTEDLEFDYYLSNLESKGLLSKSKELENYYFEKVCGSSVENSEELNINTSTLNHSDFKIEEVGIQNFRNIGNYQNFKLSPITFFTGENNSGKSSVLKSFLMLTGLSFDSNNDRFIINPNSNQGILKQLNLDYKSIFNIESDSKIISISVNLDFNLSKFPSEKLIMKFDFQGNEIDSVLELNTFTIDFSEEQYDVDFILKLSYKENVKKLSINKSVFIDDFDEEPFEYDFGTEIGLGFNNLFFIDAGVPLFYLLSENEKSKKEISDLNRNQELLFLFGKIQSIIGSLLIEKQFTYIPALRSEISREFSPEKSFFGGVLESLENNSENEFLTNEINYWLSNDSYFKIGTSYNVTKDAYGRYILYIDDKHISDMGFGTLQIFSVIAASILSSFSIIPKGLVIIEEPESNLHPNLQSRLANFFFEINKKYNTQFLIETHSEYLIRKSQVIGVENDLFEKYPNVNPFGIYYIDKSGGYQIRYNKNGRFNKEFGTGFFDESSNCITDLIKNTL